LLKRHIQFFSKLHLGHAELKAALAQSFADVDIDCRYPLRLSLLMSRAFYIAADLVVNEWLVIL
jgi:hypothetical protein